MGVDRSEKDRRAPMPLQKQRPSYGGVPLNGHFTPLDWTQVNPELVTGTIAAVNRAGDAISFARGAKGRWLSVTLLSGDGGGTFRCFDVDEAEAQLQAILKTADARSQD
jgi:hypothetical protein